MTKRILVVEDQADLRAILRDLLTGSGYLVAEAAAVVSKPASSEAVLKLTNDFLRPRICLP